MSTLYWLRILSNEKRKRDKRVAGAGRDRLKIRKLICDKTSSEEEEKRKKAKKQTKDEEGNIKLRKEAEKEERGG